MTAKSLLLLTVALAFAAAGCARQNNCCFKEPVTSFTLPPSPCDTCK